jgi:hypothetical protein
MVGADRTRDVDVRGAKIAGRSTLAEVNASAWKSKPDIGQTLRRIAALQITAGSRDDLAVWPPSEATGCVLYLICSQ